jgi:Flp pilus assembly pilin Flp
MPMLSNITSKARRLIAEECGATLVEYVLMIVLIALAALVGVSLFGNSVGYRMNASSNKIGEALQ